MGEDIRSIEKSNFIKEEMELFSLIYKREKVATRKGLLIGILIGIIATVLFQKITGY